MADILALNCPSCGGKGHMVEGTNRFHCDYCGTESLIQLSYQTMPAPAHAPAEESGREGPMIRPKVPVPSSIRIEEDADGSRIIQRWFSAKFIFMAFFCVAWDSFLCVWYSSVLTGMRFGGGGIGGPGILFALFPLLHVGVGVYLTYYTLAGFLNRTTVELNQGTLATYFDPLPWPGEVKIPTAELKQLYCKEERKNGKRGSVHYTYTLYAVTRDDRQVKVLAGLDSLDVARSFEQQLETWLRIKDQRVQGELK